MFDLEAVKARFAAASDAPWLYDERVGCAAVYAGSKQNCLHGAERWAIAYVGAQQEYTDDGVSYQFNLQALRNLQFIAHARTDLPAAVAEIERLRAIERLWNCAVDEEGTQWAEGIKACVEEPNDA